MTQCFEKEDIRKGSGSSPLSRCVFEENRDASSKFAGGDLSLPGMQILNHGMLPKVSKDIANKRKY